MKYLIDIMALAGLLIFCYGLWMIYPPLAFIAFGMAVMLLCVKLSKVKIPEPKK